MSVIAVLDACVLYPAPLRDFLMHLALAEVYRAKWSEMIHDEWIKNLLENRPDLTAETLDRTRRLMNAHALDCVVEGFENLISKVDLPDPDDRHVLAAAIKSGADRIVTYNLGDFPSDELSRWKMIAVHPDTFLSELLKFDPEGVVNAFSTLKNSLRKPKRSAGDLLITYRDLGLEEFVEEFAREIEP